MRLKIILVTLLSLLATSSVASPFFTSWYGGGEKLNRFTSSGQVFRPEGLTAAHRTLPLGTKLEVTRGSRSVVVTVNDRGPALWTGRNLDLSKGAAARLGFLSQGTSHVDAKVISNHVLVTKSEHQRSKRGVMGVPRVDTRVNLFGFNF